MTARPAFALEYASLFGLNPIASAQLAANLGFDHFTIALAPGRASLAGHAPWSLREDAALRRELLAVMTDCGVSLSSAEGIAIVPGRDVREACAADLALLASLGVPRINVVSLDTDLPRTHDQYAALTEVAASHGIKTLVEFVPIFPVASLAMAQAVIAHVGRPECRIMLDTMHFCRTGGTVEALDPVSIGYVQICDVPAAPVIADYLEEAVCQRRVPGEGDLPLASIVKSLPQELVFGIEIPLRAEMQVGESDASRMARCLAATSALFD